MFAKSAFGGTPSLAIVGGIGEMFIGRGTWIPWPTHSGDAVYADIADADCDSQLISLEWGGSCGSLWR